MFEKILDLLSLLVFSVFGIAIVKLSQSFIWLLGGIFVILTAALLIALTFSFKQGSFMAAVISFLIPFKRLKAIMLDMLSYFDTVKKDRKRIVLIILLSFLMWFINLFQSYLFFWVIGVKMNFFVALGLIPLGILVGMIPITIAGMGTRDTAFILLFSNYAPTSVMVLFGLLFSLRYFIPALVGLIYVNKFLGKTNEKNQK